jgi:hypothetical protein
MRGGQLGFIVFLYEVQVKRCLVRGGKHRRIIIVVAGGDELLQTIPVLRSGIDISFWCEIYVSSLHHNAAILSIVLSDWRRHLRPNLDRIHRGLEIECLVVVHLALGPGGPGHWLTA